MKSHSGSPDRKGYLFALHTPGHTPEHLSFLLFDQQGCGDPLGIFNVLASDRFTGYVPIFWTASV